MIGRELVCSAWNDRHIKFEEILLRKGYFNHVGVYIVHVLLKISRTYRPGSRDNDSIGKLFCNYFW